ncbi:type II secretion system secretin GspD [Pseudomonas chlororaphis]|uniref:type II secretion system secretin GspD n=1 Tax=Pseudomonas chlororaphis TaxID=587753 RepID=UPI000F559D49|nr:type II secretion system secretin GspD [Pseudomonas chlororaphis]AZE07271.1 General secretion pathway protein D [Pseudomonas chlororaphis subsp. aureofaciens]MBP5062871.1 type II secretion system secretin GspD [Pseudomonas chlororaphis]QTT96536.1 type II secretion system secretin GspD [Pseudomonas chlororaphis]
MKLSQIAGAMLSLGLLLNTLPSSAALTTQRLWTLNMKDAELRDLASEVGEITGKTLVVDARLQGKVSVQSSKALDKDGIYSLFLSVLRSQGFVALDQGDRVLIMPTVEAKTKSSDQSGDEFVTRVLDLRNANAAEISGVVRPLVSDDAYVAPSASSNALVVSDSASNVERIRQVVSELDQAGNRSFSTVALKHAWASDVARTLNESISQNGNGPSQAKAVGDTRSNRVILAGSAQARQRMAELVRAIDVPSNSNDSARVVRLHHSDAKQLSKLLNGIGKRLEDGNRAGGEGKGGGNSILVSADESQNALVLMADPAQLSMLNKVITQLDQPRAQVLVEAAIVEVSGDINEALGVQWAARAGNVAGGTNFSGTGLSIGTLLGNGKDKNITLPDGAIIGIGTSNFGALVTALSSDSKNNLLSTPSLLTLDNEAAEILVGQNVPFQTGSYTTDTAGASNPFTTVERQDVGVTLKVTPHINEGNTLRLKVEQESSELASAPPGITTSDVITNKRSVKSTILADDGQIIVLGGLIKDNVKTQVSKVPVLGSIPLLGRLFTSTKDVTEKTNLMVFLRPTLVRGSADAVNVSERKYNDLRKLRANGDSRSGLALPADSRQLFDAAPQDGTIDMRAREPRR